MLYNRIKHTRTENTKKKPSNNKSALVSCLASVWMEKNTKKTVFFLARFFASYNDMVSDILDGSNQQKNALIVNKHDFGQKSNSSTVK